MSTTTATAPESGAHPGRQASVDPRASAEKELLDAAKAHKVKIRAEQMISASNRTTTISHAPIDGIQRYGDDDFAKGAALLLLIIHSSTPQAVLNGSYTVKVQHQRGATSGEALFIDQKGAIVARRPLILRTQEQSAVLFPDVYSGGTDGGGPLGIPNITSIHHWGNGHVTVDCAGWQPYRVLYFSA